MFLRTTFLNTKYFFLTLYLIQSFLKDPKHLYYLEKTITNPNLENRKVLDIVFKEFYLKIRLSSYISKIIYSYSINFDKKLRASRSRYQLADEKFLTSVATSENMIEKVVLHFKDSVDDLNLYTALQSLTERQVTIIELAYICRLTDRQIAITLGVTRQAVTKSRNKALESIRSALKGVE